MLEKNQVNKYDADHDVLHVFLGNQYNASAEEEFPGVYVSRDDDTEEIVGFTVIDYRKNRHLLHEHYPQYDFTVSVA